MWYNKQYKQIRGTKNESIQRIPRESPSWEAKSDHEYCINAYEYKYSITHFKDEPVEKIHKWLGFVLRYDYGYNHVISQVMLKARESICSIVYYIYSKKMSNKNKIAFLESSDNKDFM